MLSLSRASRAKLQRLEKETRELEKSIEALRHYQAKCGELEKMNKKLQSQAHTDRREVIRLKEEVQGSRSKVTRLEKQQSEMKSQEERLEDIDGASTRKMMVSAPGHNIAHTGRYKLYKYIYNVQHSHPDCTHSVSVIHLGAASAECPPLRDQGVVRGGANWAARQAGAVG